MDRLSLGWNSVVNSNAQVFKSSVYKFLKQSKERFANKKIYNGLLKSHNLPYQKTQQKTAICEVFILFSHFFYNLQKEPSKVSNEENFISNDKIKYVINEILFESALSPLDKSLILATSCQNVVSNEYAVSDMLWMSTVSFSFVTRKSRVIE